MNGADGHALPETTRETGSRVLPLSIRTRPTPTMLGAGAAGLAVGLLLAACSSSSPTRANTPTSHLRSSIASSSPTAPTSTTATAVEATSPAAPAGDANACALVSEQEAGAALGADPGVGQAVTAHGASSCTYGTSPRIVTLNRVPSGGKAAYDHLRAQATAGQLVDMSGVGDGAFGTFHGPAASIDFYKGDTFVAVVLITGQASAPPKDQAIALAKTAASRI